MSVISRSSRRTSCLQQRPSAGRAGPWSLTRSQRLQRRADRGQGVLDLVRRRRRRSRSMASIRSDRVSVMVSSERARSPISSLRPSRSGREMARARCSRTSSAAADSRITGRATNRCSSSDASRFTRQRHQGEGHQGPALGVQDLVDVAGLQRQHAQHLLRHGARAWRPRPRGRRSRSDAPWPGASPSSAASTSAAELGVGALQTCALARFSPSAGSSERRAGRSGGRQGLAGDRLGHGDSCRRPDSPSRSNRRARWPAGMKLSRSQRLASIGSSAGVGLAAR